MKDPSILKIENLNLTKEAQNFILNGAKDGNWHNSINQCVGSLVSNGFNDELIYLIMESVAIRKGNGVGLDENDLSHINDILSRWGEPKEEETNRESFLPTRSDVKGHLRRQRVRRKTALEKSVPFLSEVFERLEFRLDPGLILIGNISGKGKTTCVINIAAEVVRKTDHKVLIITGEVDAEDYYSAVASNLLNLDFHSYRKGQLNSKQSRVIEEKSEQIVDQLLVIGNSQNPDIQKPKEVIKVMKAAVAQGYGLIVLDYYQRINDSSLDSITTIKKFGNELNKFCNTNVVPVVAMVQLRPNNSSFPEHLSQRIQEDRHVYNHAHLVLEMNTNQDENTVNFNVVKSRFSRFKERGISLVYRNGRLVFDPDHSLL